MNIKMASIEEAGPMNSSFLQDAASRIDRSHVQSCVCVSVVGDGRPIPTLLESRRDLICVYSSSSSSFIHIYMHSGFHFFRSCPFLLVVEEAVNVLQWALKGSVFEMSGGICFFVFCSAGGWLRKSWSCLFFFECVSLRLS